MVHGLRLGSLCAAQLLFSALIAWYFKPHWWILAAITLPMLALALWASKRSVLEQAKALLNDKRQADMAALEGELEQTDPRALSQLRNLREKLTDFVQVLDLRFERDELAFRRYRGAADALYLSTISSLRDLCAHHKSIRSIDAPALNQSLVDGSAIDPDQVRQRLAMHQQTSDKILELLKHNEQAITVLASASAQLAEVKTAKSRSELAQHEALRRLLELAEQSEQYAKS